MDTLGRQGSPSRPSRYPIEDGQAVVQGGSSTVSEARHLADLLNAGALPVDLELVSIR